MRGIIVTECSCLFRRSSFNIVKLFRRNDATAQQNLVGIRMLPEPLRQLIFGPNKETVLDQNLIKKVVSHLQEHKLWGRASSPTPGDMFDDKSLPIPQLFGSNLDEHFRKLATDFTQPYVKLVEQLVASPILPPPKSWLFEPGWVRYPADTTSPPKAVPFPVENGIILDVETISSFPVLACAMSHNAVYLWCSEWLVTSKDDVKPADSARPKHLIPLNNDQSIAQLVIGHNVSYDRSFVREQYTLDQDLTRFLDTMSLHMAVSGLTSFQRVLFNARKTGSTRKEVREMVFRNKSQAEAVLARKQLEDPDFNLLSGQRFKWMDSSTLNNLRDVHSLYCPEEKRVEKEQRNIFISGSIEDVRKDFQQLATYCFSDVVATKQVFHKLWPMFGDRFPHPVTLAGMLEMGCPFLPVDQTWLQYIATSDSAYHALESSLKSLFMRLANDAVSMLHGERYKTDPWLWDLDWTVQGLKLNKPKTSKKTPPPPENPTSLKELMDTTSRLPKRRPHLPGYPKWFSELVEQNGSTSEVFGPTLISQQMRLVPKLLRLTWNGYLVHYDDKQGWGYLVPDANSPSSPVKSSEESPYANFPKEAALKITEALRHSPSSVLDESVINGLDGKDVEETGAHRIELARMISDAKGSREVTPESEEKEKPKKRPIPIENDKSPSDGMYCPDVSIPGFKFFRIPHKDGLDNRVGNPLSKSFLGKFTDGTLRANCGEDGNRIVEVGQICSYWKNNRDRISEQLVVWTNEDESTGKKTGFILPRVITAGTVTRRAVEPTWLTASNARKDRLGSELKAMVRSPEGYNFVGADVDSQELWIAAVIGDAYFAHIHGCTALGWMTLQGNKTEGTDMHSKTASTLVISRDHAKIINYGRIYGAGRQFAERLLMQFNPKVTPAEAKQRVEAMYAQTKGVIRFLPVYDEQSKSWIRKRLWYGGSESAMFNKLEEIARSPEPRTPVLGCRISRALEPANVHGDFITSRINWVVQSSAVDYLHLMLVATRWLFQCFQVKGRFSISIHDEVRYVVKSEDRHKAALALHLANLFTRAMFAHKLGFTDLPLCVAFFSSVDIDRCLRKEPFYDCVTPSNSGGLKKTYGIEPGLTINIKQTMELLEKEHQDLKKLAMKN